MKTSVTYISLALVATAAGATLFTLAGASFTAAFRGDITVAVVTAISILGFAVYDYSRRTVMLKAPTRLLRPSIPARMVSTKTKAYGIKAVREERLAA